MQRANLPESELGFATCVVADDCITIDKPLLDGHTMTAADAKMHSEYATVADNERVLLATAARRAS